MPRLKGALPTPRNRLAAARPYVMGLVPAPAQWICIPRTLSMWLNNQYGDCVTAEEAFAKACSGILISDAEVKRWATAHNVLNGAYLDEVLDWMKTSGFQQDGNVYNDGGKTSVDWMRATALEDAIFAGPVKLGVASAQLEQVVGSNNGWFGLNFHADQNLDHCIALCGYGPIGWLANQLGVTLVQGANPNVLGYAAFTWKTIGILDGPSMEAITGEAWSRSPTTLMVGNNPPTPDVVYFPEPLPPNPPNPPLPPTPPPPVNRPSITLPRAILPGELVRFKNGKPGGIYDLRMAADELVIEVE